MIIRDPFGFQRHHYELEGQLHAPTVRAIFTARPELPRALDPLAIAAHMRGATAPDHSFFSWIRSVPPGHELVSTPDGFTTRDYPIVPVPGDLLTLVRTALERAIASAPGPLAVALSGGLDSAVVLALVHEIDPSIPALVLSPSMDDYNELAQARQTAASIGSELCVAEVQVDDYREALPDAICAMEVPLYNLHPVGKLLLARAARKEGFATLLTGDGIDQVFTRDRSADYLPLVAAAFEATGVALHTPFLDDSVIRHLFAQPVDRNKGSLRELAATLPIPPALVAQKKVSRLAPPIDLAPLVSRTKLKRLAEVIDLPYPDLPDDRTQVRFATLALLLDAFEAWL